MGAWFERGTLDFKSDSLVCVFLAKRKGLGLNPLLSFPENEAPLIKNFLLTPDEFHNEYVELSATIEDQEGDPVTTRS